MNGSPVVIIYIYIYMNGSPAVIIYIYICEWVTCVIRYIYIYI